jgi:hypothetical protein
LREEENRSESVCLYNVLASLRKAAADAVFPRRITGLSGIEKCNPIRQGNFLLLEKGVAILRAIEAFNF